MIKQRAFVVVGIVPSCGRAKVDEGLILRAYRRCVPSARQVAPSADNPPQAMPQFVKAFRHWAEPARFLEQVWKAHALEPQGGIFHCLRPRWLGRPVASSIRRPSSVRS